MKDDSQAMAAEGVRFFGEISASISHEIKNVLAIINENAGLLQDMVMMIEKGMPLSPERLSGLAQSMARQVKRGDRIVKDMNRFAHSADHPSETVDIGEVIHFICVLAARLIAMKGEATEGRGAGHTDYRRHQPVFSGRPGVALPVPGHGCPCPKPDGMHRCRESRKRPPDPFLRVGRGCSGQ